MYTRTMSIPRPSKPALALCILSLSAIIAIAGWNGAKNNPRDGWSWVKAKIGLAPVPAGGDRAYFLAGYGIFARIDPDPSEVKSVTVLVRRDRSGLLIPWRETVDLRMVSASGRPNPWHTGSNAPHWHEILGQSRTWYIQQDSQEYQGVIDGIDNELAGNYPQYSIRPVYLALEILVLLAHGILAAGVFYPIHLALKSKYQTPNSRLILDQKPC